MTQIEIDLSSSKRLSGSSVDQVCRSFSITMNVCGKKVPDDSIFVLGVCTGSARNYSRSDQSSSSRRNSKRSSSLDGVPR